MPPGLWEPAGISSHQITAFRATALALLSALTIVGFLAAQYLDGIVFLSLLVMAIGVFATRHVYDHVYREQIDYLETGKVTLQVALEIPHKHSDRNASSLVVQARTGLNPNREWVGLKDYQASKVENQNIAIFGRMGTGKTTLGMSLLANSEADFQKIVFSYKRRDTGRYQELGYERWDMSQHRIDPWSGNNKEAFVRALGVAIDLDPGSGITANSVMDLVEDLIKRSNSWTELFVEIKIRMKQAGSDTVTRLALTRIGRALKVIYDPNASYFSVPRKNVFLDYGLVKSRTIKSFDSEFLLELLYDEIISGQRNKVLLYIDEAHRLLRNKDQSGKNLSIIEELISREIRDTGSKLYLCTQSYQDVDPTARDQFAAQYIFRTLEPKTIAELNQISELLAQAVADLDPYNFVDVNQDYRGARVREAVYHFKLHPRTPETHLAKAIEQTESTKPLPPSPPILSLPAANYLTKVLDLLERDPMITQEIATQLIRDELGPQDASNDWKPTSDQVSAMKLRIKDSLLKLLEVHDGELADVLLLQDEYRDKPKSLYFLKDKGDKKVHARLTEITKRILKDHNVSKITEGRDRVSEADFELPNCLIEVETGLRRGNTRDLEDRIKELRSKPFIIVVPNDKTREKYKQFAQDGRTKALVLYELGYYLDQQGVR